MASREGVRNVAAIAVALGVLSACSTPEQPVEIFDPYEEQNRQTHAFNKGLDRAVLRPVSQVWDDIPRPATRIAANFAENLDTPGYVLNQILQGEIEDAGHNVFRFVLNTTLGVGGLFDPASSFGLTPREADFGQTLHAWGAEEGAYLELPFLGPSTERDAAGFAVDIALNPLRFVIPDTGVFVTPGTFVIDVIDTRAQLGGTLDQVLYESADSYAQTRSLYLQNRRFEVGTPVEDTYFDPYEELYGE